MAPAGAASQFDQAALQRRQELTGVAGPLALLRNAKVFGIACFACIGGLLYGYNQGVFSGVLTMNNFGKRKIKPSQHFQYITYRRQTWAYMSQIKPRKAG